MKSSDRAILLGVIMLAAIAAAWLLLLGPKRDQVSTLDGEIEELRTSVQQSQQLATAAEAAKADYEANYHHLVVLGKAAPTDDDTASLLVELDKISARAGTSLNTIKLDDSGGGSAAPTTPPPASTETSPSGVTSGSSTSTTTSTSTTAAATEASASLLPLGATVGPAGLPVMPYELTLKGNYFQMADYINGLQRLVGSKAGRRVVDGRLVTIDGFTFAGDETKGFPELDATLNVTTYVAPADQGLTGGATPAGPAPTTDPTTDPTAVPASQATPTTTTPAP